MNNKIKYKVIVTADINDGDVLTESNIISLEDNVFSGWGESLSSRNITYLMFLKAFSETVQKSNFCRYANYREEDQDKIIEATMNLLKLSVDTVSLEEIQDLIRYFIPTNSTYPIHSIKSIEAYPIDSIIKIF